MSGCDCRWVGQSGDHTDTCLAVQEYRSALEAIAALDGFWNVIGVEARRIAREALAAEARPDSAGAQITDPATGGRPSTETSGCRFPEGEGP